MICARIKILTKAVWAVILYSKNLFCRLDPGGLPAGLFEILQFVSGMQNYIKLRIEGKIGRLKIESTHCNSIDLRMVCPIIILIECLLSNRQCSSDSRIVFVANRSCGQMLVNMNQLKHILASENTIFIYFPIKLSIKSWTLVKIWLSYDDIFKVLLLL